MDLGESKMRYLRGDFLGSLAQLVPAGNAADGNACAGDSRPAAADLRRLLDKCSNVGYGGHNRLLQQV